MIDVFLAVLETPEEKEKFTELYDKYKNLLYFIARGRTGSTEDAEECVQETFFYVANHFEKIEEVNSKRTKAYLATIVTGYAIDMYNKSHPEHSLQYDIKDEESDITADFESLELAHAIEKALSEQEKIFMYMKYIYGYKSSEIAEMYKVKDSFVRKKIQIAKTKLRKYLKEEYDYE